MIAMKRGFEMQNPIQVYNQLNDMDLHVIEFKLSQADLKGYSVQEVKREGLRFMALMAASKKSLTPSPLVDEVWHQCILDTKTYFKMSNLFGRYIHHNPASGTKKEMKANAIHFWNTIDLYEKNFGKLNKRALGIWGLEIKKRVKE